MTLVERFSGMRPPRFPSIFEALLNGISNQQISVAAGLTLLNRLSAQYGPAYEGSHAFPQPKELAQAKWSDLRRLGYSRRKAETIIGIAQAIVHEAMDFESLERLDDETLCEHLQEIDGVGRWTAQYVALRGLRRLDVFPADDVGSQSKLQHWLGLKNRPGYEDMHRILDHWEPYRGLIYFYLLLDYQARQGFFAEATETLSTVTPALAHVSAARTEVS